MNIWLLLQLLVPSIIHANIECYNYQECRNRTIETTSGDIDCRGLESCSFCSINNEGINNNNDNRHTYCWGTASCSHSHNLQGSVEYSASIEGYLGLAWSETISTTGVDIACGSEAGCYGIDTLSKNTLYCYSTRSCDSIKSAVNITNLAAHGAFSAIYSNIYSDVTTKKLSATLYGFYAGFGSSIYCLSGHSCSVTCGVNACFNLEFICNSNVSSCTVTCDPSNGVICPNGWDINSEYDADYNKNGSDYIYHDYLVSTILAIDEQLFNITFGGGYLWETWNRSYVDSYETTKEALEQNKTGYTFCNDFGSDCSYAIDEYWCNFKDIDTKTTTERDNLTSSNIYCSSAQGCSGAYFVNNDFYSGYNIDCDIQVYCDGSFSCDSTIMRGINVVYARGMNSIGSAVIEDFNACIITASNAFSTESRRIENGTYVGCYGEESCRKTSINNVSMIVAAGYKALDDSTIVSNGNDLIVFAIGYDSLSHVTMICSAFDICTIYYYQTDAYKSASEIGCDTDQSCVINVLRVSTIVDGVTKFPTVLPTMAPTVTDDMTQFQKDITKVTKLLNKVTIILAIIVGITSVVLIIVSKTCHVSKRDKMEDKLTSQWIEYEVTQRNGSQSVIIINNKSNNTMIRTNSASFTGPNSGNITPNEIDIYGFNDDNTNNTNNNNNSNSDKNSLSVNSDYLRNIQAVVRSSTSSPGTSVATSHRNSISGSYYSGKFVNYLVGFGKHSNHFAVALISLETFDVFTDISYLLELLQYGYIYEFMVFLSSIALVFCINVIILIRFIKREFHTNPMFLNWFYEHSGTITCLLLLLSLTDMTMLVTVFTSQLFGHSTFYSPISLKAIDTIQICGVISIFVEHLPQFAIQLYVILYKLKEFDVIVISTLVVNIIDILYVVIKAIVWMVIYGTKRFKHSQDDDQNEDDVAPKRDSFYPL